MGEIYLTSDTHFCHDKEFLWRPRGCENVYEMNEKIIENWNKTVKSGDEVYLLGDIMLKDNIQGEKLLHSLNGWIHIILGNHDTAARYDIFSRSYNVLEIETAMTLKYNKYNFFLCHYPTLCSNYDDGKDLKHKMISLCGHRHVTDPFYDWDKGCIYHVELDAHNLTPVHIDEVIEAMEVKMI